MKNNDRNAVWKWLLLFIIIIVSAAFPVYFYFVNASLIVSSQPMLPVEQNTIADVIKQSSIQDVTNESYTSQYDLRVTCFFDKYIWDSLDADSKAFILQQTINDQANYYGLPMLIVDVSDLPNTKAFQNCIESRISIDREFLLSANAEEALFVTHRAFYYLYAERLIAQLLNKVLPEKYSGCKVQLEQYQKDMVNGVYPITNSLQSKTHLEDDSIAFSFTSIDYYLSWKKQEHDSPLFESYVRKIWSEALNPHFKTTLLEKIANEFCANHNLPQKYKLEQKVNSVKNKAPTYDANFVVIPIDEVLLSEGDPSDCLKVIVYAIAHDLAQNLSDISNTDPLTDEWTDTAIRLAWDRLIDMLQEENVI